MNLKELEKRLNELCKDYKDFADNIAPEIIGKTAKDFYKESFQNEGFTDKGLNKWPEVKRRENPRRPELARASRKILTETGNLRRSIDYETFKGRVVVTAEVFSKSGFNYAPVHNFGTKKIPRRMFVGESSVLNEKILEKIREKIKKISQNR